MIGHNSQIMNANALSTEQRKKIFKTIQALEDSFTRVAAEKELQREAIQDLYDEVGIDKRLIRKLARTYFNSNFSQESEEYSTFEDFYRLIVEKEGE